MYEHCRMLNKAGVAAHPLHESDFTLDWFEHREVPLTLADLPAGLESDDVVVGNEVFPYAVNRINGGQRVMFVQSTAQVLSGFQRGPRNPTLLRRAWNRVRPTDLRPAYEKLGYRKVITCSDHVGDYLFSNFQIPSTTITNGIDHDLLNYRPERKEPMTVLCLPRKNAQDLTRIRSLAKHLDLRFIEVDGIPFESLVQHYQRADIFLATGYPEGFSLPPLEAMACGCAVIGFTGGGGEMFMKERQTALVAPDGDCEEAARRLEELVNDPNLKETIRAGGLDQAQQFSMARMGADLLACYREF